MEVLAYGLLRDAEPLADLALIQPLEEVKHRHLALPLREHLLHHRPDHWPERLCALRPFMARARVLVRFVPKPILRDNLAQLSAEIVISQKSALNLVMPVLAARRARSRYSKFMYR